MMINEGLIIITFSHLNPLPLPPSLTLCMKMCVCVPVQLFLGPIKQIISHRAFESILLKKNFLKINCAFE